MRKRTYSDETTIKKPTSPQEPLAEILVQHHARFLRFISSRMSDPGASEDILHSAYIKALEHRNQLQADESVIAWFYRILRNSVVDHYRRSTRPAPKSCWKKS